MYFVPPRVDATNSAYRNDKERRTPKSKKKDTAYGIVSLLVHPLSTSKQSNRFDLFSKIVDALREADLSLQNGDVLVISSKYISISQGRKITISKITESPKAGELGRKHHIKPEIAEAILRESDQTLGGTPGFVLTVSDGVIAPNAGIDRSSAGADSIILYPQNPHRTAEQIRRKIFLEYAVCVGIIISDSRLMPGRVGTVGTSVACAGIEPVSDMRGRNDLDGRPLKVTFQATADGLAAAANHIMGEGAQATPIALVRNSGARMVERRIDSQETTVAPARCLYIRSLGQHT